MPQLVLSTSIQLSLAALICVISSHLLDPTPLCGLLLPGDVFAVSEVCMGHLSPQWSLL